MGKWQFSKLIWWKVLLMTIVVGLCYAALVSSNWERFVKMTDPSEPEEYSEKDLLNCEPGTHQVQGHCVSNPSRASSAPGLAPATQGAAPTPAGVKK